jgi:hypothetical protein
MNKLKMLALAALVAATVGIGALAAAPSASALPPSVCRAISQQADIYIRLAEESRDWVGLGAVLHRYYASKADEYTAFWDAGCLG